MLRRIVLAIKIISVLLMLLITASTATASERILFIPHDNRPISSKQTAEVIEKAGYEIVMPPMSYLSNGRNTISEDGLWQWLFDNAPTARAAVISSDALLYGGLIPSRKHDISQEDLSARIDNFTKLREDNPNLNLYVFGSLMRTPYSGTIGDIEEPSYYAEHGANIFGYTKFLDKQEISKLNRREQSYLTYLENNIPAEIFNDWIERRQKNLNATKRLADLTKRGIINYMIVGRDDNSELSQTHREHRELQRYVDANNIPKHKFHSPAGIDEFGILLLTRAVNEISGEIPFVNVAYNTGVGAATVPAYSDERIGASIKDAVAITGGMLVPTPVRADFVLLVNTDPKGKTFHVHNPYPDGKQIPASSKPNKGTKYFATLVEKNVNAGYPVGIADVNFANGSDNALMKLLHDKNLLYRLQAYSGWNTATNSTGFVLGMGILSRHMTDDAKARLLSRRYLDDWGYQANIRTVIGNELFSRGKVQNYFRLNEERREVELRETELLREFAAENLPHYDFLRDLRVVNTWDRMFECDIIFGDE